MNKEKPKPKLVWHVGYEENGKTRVARTKAEKREIDEIIKEYHTGRNAALMCALTIISETEFPSKSLSRIGEDAAKKIREQAKDLVLRIRTGRECLEQLIDCVTFHGMFVNLETQTIPIRRLHMRIKQARQDPNVKKLRDRRYDILEPIFGDTQNWKEINKRVLDLPREKRKSFASLPIPKSTLAPFKKRFKRLNQDIVG